MYLEIISGRIIMDDELGRICEESSCGPFYGEQTKARNFSTRVASTA
jgi:hypothetical protein